MKFKHIFYGLPLILIVILIAVNIKTKLTQTKAGNSININSSIVVLAPTDNEVLTSPFVLSGQTTISQEVLSYKLFDEKGDIIIQNFLPKSPEFSVSVTFPETNSKSGRLEVFSLSAIDGTESNKVNIPISFNQ